MENKYSERMSKLTDDKLVKVVGSDKQEYEPLAVEAAEHEIKKRNLDLLNFTEQEREYIESKEQLKETETGAIGCLYRAFHYIVDFTIITIVWFIISYLAAPFLSIISEELFLLITYLPIFIFYYYIMENKYQKTVGKFITKSKVVNLNGEKPTRSEILNRTLCRFIPFDNISFIFVKNGFHDKLSYTSVIKD